MNDQFELEILATMPNYYAWIMDVFRPFVRGQVIEYGAGTGTFSRLLAPLADRLMLVEPSASLSGELRRAFSENPKIEVVTDSLEQHAARIGASAFDSVVMVNVLEHIENDAQALADLFRILRPGGRLLVFVPALQGLMSKLDRLFGHFRRYHRDDLVNKVASAGGKAQLCRYFDLFGILPWFVLNKLMGATSFNPSLVAVHDKLVVPLSRAVEGVIAPPVGKNLILVAEKI